MDSKLTVTLNRWQLEAFETFEAHDVIFVTGIAGTAKTFTATCYAINKLLSNKTDSIFITRPTVEATGIKSGFLPGDASEKSAPFLEPIYDCMNDLTSDKDAKTRDHIKQNTKVLPLAFARGRTMKSAVCILDEAQNCTLPQLKIWMTRMGKTAKLIITGDPGQSDIYESPLGITIRKMTEDPRIGHYHFPPEANMRHPLVELFEKVFYEIARESRPEKQEDHNSR